MSSEGRSVSDPVMEFRQAMEQVGIVTDDELTPTHKIRRFHVEGDGPGKKNGWYVLRLQPWPHGAFGSWKLGISEKWSRPLPKNLSKQEQVELRKRRDEVVAAQQAGIERQQVKAQKTAVYIWNHSAPAPADHPYLKEKRIGPKGARLYQGKLVLPVYDTEHILHSLQRIAPDGDKKFLEGGRVAGCLYDLGNVKNRLYIAEGFATGATIHDVTGEAVAIAYNAGNLKPVAEALRKKYPKTEIVIAADNDQWTEGNPGLSTALEGAKVIKGKVAVPKFRDVRTHPTDFNDLFCLEGAAAVREQLRRACAPRLLERVPGTLASQVKAEKVRWLWKNRVPLGEVTILEGDPNVGKSTVAFDLAARVSQGWRMPDGSEAELAPQGVVIVSLEDSPSHTIRPRLQAAGADLSRIRIVDSITAPDGILRTPTIPQDLPEIEKAIQAEDARLLIIDPVIATFDSQTNTWKDQDVRRAIAPLKKLAEERQIAVLTVRHLNKTQGANPLYRGGGSIAFIAAARAGMLAAKDPDNPGCYVLAMSKSNLGPEQPSLCYRIEGYPDPARVVWEGDSPHTAVNLLDNSGGEEERSKVDDAAAFLNAMLANGRQDQKDVVTEARKQGISERTLWRARKKVGVNTEREGQGKEHKSYWKLPLPAKGPSLPANNESLAGSDQPTDLTGLSSVISSLPANFSILAGSDPGRSRFRTELEAPVKAENSTPPVPEPAQPHRSKREKVL